MVVNSDFIIAGTAINATTTSNNHKFLPEVLRESAESLVGVPLLVDHENKVENIKGRVFHAIYDEDNQRIPFKAKVMDNTIKTMIKDGRLNSVSVGATVDPKNIDEEDGVLIPRNIKFRELSLVAVPADQGATFNIAFNQAYKESRENEEDDEDEDKEEDEDDMVEEKTIIQVKEENIQVNQEEIERRSKMNEQTEAVEKVEVKVVETVVEDKTALFIKSLSEKVDKLTRDLEVKKNEKVEVVVEQTEEVEEKPYKIVQERGSLRGGAFTLIRNKY
jgi:hypothetical protein